MKPFLGKSLVVAAFVLALAAPASADCVLANLGIGSTVSGTLSGSSCLAADGTYYNVYRFAGQQGQRLRFTLTGVSLPDLRLQLQRTSSGTTVVVVFSQDLPTPGPLIKDQVLPEADDAYLLFVGTVTPAVFGNYTIQAQDLDASTACANTGTTLCLNSRFKVTAGFAVNGVAGVGNAAPITTDTGYFWFFTAGNVEVVVKVVDGRSFNNRFWVFAGGLTNVDATITVTDTQTGLVRTYHNPANTAFQPIQDTSAF
jgi:hypothetical protein